jgi:NTP pyrophosphatase (non-canonical NTP hydrolase)
MAGGERPGDGLEDPERPNISWGFAVEVSAFQGLIRDIYFQRDARRGLDKTFLWFLEEVGELTRSYRRGERTKIGSEMADVFAWLASMANLLDVDLESELLKKYPQACPLCSSVPCTCPFR